MAIGLGIFFLWALYRIMIDPGLLSPKGTVIFLIGVAANFGVWWLVVTIWHAHLHFTFTPTHLIAVHRFRGKQIEVPWETIVRVRKLPRSWWELGGGGLSISVVETADGQRIPFMTHLMLRYKTFLDELQARAINCRSFDPYRSEWDR